MPRPSQKQKQEVAAMPKITAIHLFALEFRAKQRMTDAAFEECYPETYKVYRAGVTLRRRKSEANHRN